VDSRLSEFFDMVAMIEEWETQQSDKAALHKHPGSARNSNCNNDVSWLVNLSRPNLYQVSCPFAEKAADHVLGFRRDLCRVRLCNRVGFLAKLSPLFFKLTQHPLPVAA
jgi:hypothetical protein